MRSRSIRSVLLGVSVFLATITIVGADELPPPGSKPFSAILKSVEGQELGVIASAEFNYGWWEIKVCAAAACQKLYLDPKSGEEKRREAAHAGDELPPANARLLSSIIQVLEERKLGVITDVEFDNGFWEVELYKDGRKITLDIDPGTGETRR